MRGKTIFCKIHKKNNLTVLAVCDKELIGKTLSEKEICFTVSEKFYKEKEIHESKLREMLKEFDNINLIGKKSVGIALNEGLVEEKNIIKIKNIPHIQIFKL